MTLSKVIVAGAIFYVFSSIAVAQEFPTVKEFVAPPYPPVAVAVQVEGDVTVLVEVNSNGKVLSATPISGHKFLLAAARVTSEKWEFTSVPGTHYLTLTFRFRLPSPKVKEFARIRGWYTLDFAARYYRIISDPSYTTEGTDN
jgi:TonB family protein